MSRVPLIDEQMNAFLLVIEAHDSAATDHGHGRNPEWNVPDDIDLHLQPPLQAVLTIEREREPEGNMRALWSVWYRFVCWTGNHFRPTSLPEGDGFQPVGYCRKCGVRVTQDSQGNWFALGGKP